ncbi:MAG: DUF4124 domain-containing protein, partial [Pseudomonadota bacterium]
EVVPGPATAVSFRAFSRDPMISQFKEIRAKRVNELNRPRSPRNVGHKMNSRRRVRNIVSRICAAALVCAATGVSAQTIYKQVSAVGHVTFTDQPDATAARQTATDPALEVTKAPARIFTISSRRAATINANEAARRLGEAQLKRKQGAEPLPGEQAQGSDASTVNHRYWWRQEKLRLVVEQAQRRSNETRLSQVALR